MTLNEVLSQLDSLRSNSESFLEADEPDSVWAKDLEALDIAMEIVEREKERKKGNGKINRGDRRKKERKKKVF